MSSLRLRKAKCLPVDGLAIQSLADFGHKRTAMPSRYEGIWRPKGRTL